MNQFRLLLFAMIIVSSSCHTPIYGQNWDTLAYDATIHSLDTIYASYYNKVRVPVPACDCKGKKYNVSGQEVMSVESRGCYVYLKAWRKVGEYVYFNIQKDDYRTIVGEYWAYVTDQIPLPDVRIHTDGKPQNKITGLPRLDSLQCDMSKLDVVSRELVSMKVAFFRAMIIRGNDTLYNYALRDHRFSPAFNAVFQDIRQSDQLIIKDMIITEVSPEWYRDYPKYYKHNAVLHYVY